MSKKVSKIEIRRTRTITTIGKTAYLRRHRADLSMVRESSLKLLYIPCLLQLQPQPRLSSLPPLDQAPLYCLQVYSAKNRRRNTATPLPSQDCRLKLVSKYPGKIIIDYIKIICHGDSQNTFDRFSGLVKKEHIARWEQNISHYNKLKTCTTSEEIWQPLALSHFSNGPYP